MTVWFYLCVREYTDCDYLTLEQVKSLREMIDVLGERYGTKFHEYLLADDTCFYLVNGKSILHTGGLNTLLYANDKVEILPVVGAG